MILDNLLAKGKNSLGVHVGIISRIENGQYEVFAVDTDYGDIKQGDIFELQNTYCKDVITNGKTMVFDDVAEISELLKHPCYLSTQLRAYIGTPLILNNSEIWGTLNFSSKTPKNPNFSTSDFSLIESLARDITEILTLQHFDLMMSK